ncbi:hypothetical protein ACFYNM_37610 [Streptomyces spororaveus]|uniref:hypothetical protein n=1 Tax=Streptomyces spororaveus TaxID=284039 RepID=UPI0036CA9FE7
MAPGWSADQLPGHLGDDVLAVLMQGADSPRMPRPLVGLQQAGVDLGVLLPPMGRMTAGVHQAVTANPARIAFAAARTPTSTDSQNVDGHRWGRARCPRAGPLPRPFSEGAPRHRP